MIYSELQELLLKKRFTISDVSKGTGISRPTLTALTYNKSTGVQFDTLNTICAFLDVDISSIFTYLPFNLDITAHENEELRPFCSKINIDITFTDIIDKSTILSIPCLCSLNKEKHPYWIIKMSAKKIFPYQKFINTKLSDKQFIALTQILKVRIAQLMGSYYDDSEIVLLNFQKLDLWDIVDALATDE